MIIKDKKDRFILYGIICWIISLVVLALKDYMSEGFSILFVLISSIAAVRFWVIAVRGY